MNEGTSVKDSQKLYSVSNFMTLNLGNVSLCRWTVVNIPITTLGRILPITSITPEHLITTWLQK